MDGLLHEFLPTTVVGALSVLIGLAFLRLEPGSKASLGVTGSWIFSGLALITAPLLADRVDAADPGLSARLQVLFEAGTIAAAGTHMAGLLETARATAPGGALVRASFRATYTLAGVLLVLGGLFPAQRLNDYQFSLGEPGLTDRPGFWLFAGFWTVVGVVFTVGWTSVTRQDLDPGEWVRAAANIVAVPFLAAATVLPLRFAVCSFAFGMLVMLWGVFQYFAAQGERNVFLSRFLSPRVSELVRTQGLDAVMQPREVELTAVACDLRGFTSYAEAVPSQAVIDLLNEYYEAVGSAAAEFDATIKDYAGDGVLMLVGAPLPRSDHAATGLALAGRLQTAVRPVMEHWSTGPHPLGMGVGVASGRVTVGAIGSSGRMEYTAVGTPVNVAARLCSAAADGEVLVDQRTVDLAGEVSAEPRGDLQLKGLSTAVLVFALDPAG